MVRPTKIVIRQPRADEVNEGGTGLQEALALDAGIDLNDKKKLNTFNALDREDRERKHEHRIAIWAKYAGFAATVIVTAVWLVQLLLPSDRKFLNPADEKQLYSVLISGGIGAAFGRVSKSKSK